jgi:hypothetical protein
MAEFLFNLDQLRASSAATGSRINTSLYAKTPDSELVYKGDDYIVWDRINEERLRRGLPGLAAIGSPRPPEDTSGTQAPPVTGTTPPASGQASVFAVKGPPGLTREQAFEIFKKQANTGALVGFSSGDTLSAATQAADGLASAQSALQQAQSGLTGSLGAFSTSLSASGVDLATGRIASVDAAFAKGGINSAVSSFVNVIGSVQPGLGAAGGAFNGSLAGTTPGLTAAIGPAVSAFSGAVSSIPGAADAGKPLVNAAVVQNSTAISAIQVINKTITDNPVTNPITLADFTKFAGGVTAWTGAVSGIGPMGVPEVNGVLAQAKNLVGQDANVISNNKGLGVFGLNIAQLEAAGYVKPGIRALAEAGASLFATVVKSPAAWTGKDGIKNATDLLNNPNKQSLIQQDLMTKGVAGLGAVGVPVQNLSSQGIAGMSLNAAKDLASAEAFIKGLPIPGDATGSIQAEFSSAVRDAAFAVNLVNTKIPTAFKQQDIPVPSVDTVNRATLDAASNRVVGNDKVPVPSYTATANPFTANNYLDKARIFIQNYLQPYYTKLQALEPKFAALQNQQSITQAQYNALSAERDAIRNDYNINGLPKSVELAIIYAVLPELDKNVIKGGPYDVNTIAKTVQATTTYSNLQKEKLSALSQKIEGRREGN